MMTSEHQNEVLRLAQGLFAKIQSEKDVAFVL